MELSKFENGIASHMMGVKKNIEESGVHVQHEGGYSYTVGLNSVGLPELVLYRDKSVTEDDAKALFVEIKELGSVQLLNSISQKMNVSLESADELEKRRVFYAARLYYGNWDFNAMRFDWRRE